MFTCFVCGSPDHMKAECPHRSAPYTGSPPPSADAAGETRPPWCGLCDEKTRLIALDPEQARLMRCSCHPLRDEMLSQHRRCRDCHAIVYRWDEMPCERHQPVGRHQPCTHPGCPACDPESPFAGEYYVLQP